jgi:hypothetical protein
MPLPTILSGNVASALGGAYEVANSVRMNRADSPRLSKTFGTPTNQDRWTFSVWCKRSGLGTTQNLTACQSSGTKLTSLRFDSDNALNFYEYNGSYSGQIKTNRLFRDVSAWYHIVIVWDSANGTAGDRMKMYVNGVEETSFSADTNPSSGLDSDMNTSGETFDLGNANNGNFFDGYLAEAVFVDGQALTPTSFGEFDEDSPTIWKPIDVSGLTFGNNGGYFDFEDSDNLGDDESGNTNDLTEANLAAADQCSDSPTNSFCTMSPLDEPYGTVTMSEGNLVVVQSSDYPYNRATMGVASGKWYWEGKITAAGGDDVFGIASVAAASSTDYLYKSANNYAYYAHTTNHGAYGNNASISTTDYDAYTTNDIISIALDLTNNKLYFAKNGTWANSGDPTSGSTGTGAVSITDPASTVDGFYFPAAADYGGSPRATWSMNFGNPPHSISSGNADANGYGNFEYSVPSGYYALCTKNLAEFG